MRARQRPGRTGNVRIWRAREAVGDIERSAQGAQVEMQALLQQLRPASLDNTSLLEALHTQAQALGLRTGARVEVDLAALPEQDRLLPGTQETIFRLVQEAFANIARHARARTIWLTLGLAGQALRITIRDDGQGFDPAHVRSGMGLSNLRERTRVAGPRIARESAVDHYNAAFTAVIDTTTRVDSAMY